MIRHKKPLFIFFAFLLLFGAAFAIQKYLYKSNRDNTIILSQDATTDATKVNQITYAHQENFRLLIPNFNYTDKQEDIHVLQFRKGNSQESYNVMIDAAFTDQANEKLISWLKSRGISQIDEIFITHPHQDHYGGLWALINNNFPVKKIWMNIPNKEICDKEIPWGCNYKEIVDLTNLIKSKGIILESLILEDVNQKKILFQDAHNKLELLYASSPINPSLGPMDINDLSMIMKLTTNGFSYLFTGDLNKPLSEYLALNELDLSSDFLKAPHHGTEGVATNEFLDKVGASYAIVPSPQKLWCSDRSKRYREYFSDHKTKTFISGFHGDIIIHHFENHKPIFDVQNPNPSICKQ
ncbi:hypothetical protein PKF023_03330 [Polynucleobacter yangtzensis]|uniref:Metallo-beta-lactamase domain-containing protein n=1 Tax=Polynucleobacter yangtzensis TaxID=1743159 RepID=A0A9C7F9R7_9BURK|nr:MBL fold metallo-hydrolase [Polynucleobacter yangtzensis]BDT76530.1 hypothetical protein PKF023_03330 [Polynucleobacter yangtzensis]